MIVGIMRYGKTSLLLLTACAACVSGCASQDFTEINGRLQSLGDLGKKAPGAPYIVEPPDRIRVEFMKESDLTREAMLRQDGCITLPLVEDVKVVGLTTAQISDKLETLYSKYHKDPEILITVTGYNSKFLYVYGEVGRNGRIPYTGWQSVAGVIGAVGGVTRRAAPTRIRVIRGDPEDPEVSRVDLKKLLLEGDVTQDISLAQNDVVFVPPNAFAWVGYQIENLLFPFRSVLSAAFTAEAVGDIGNNDNND